MLSCRQGICNWGDLIESDFSKGGGGGAVYAAGARVVWRLAVTKHLYFSLFRCAKGADECVCVCVAKGGGGGSPAKLFPDTKGDDFVGRVISHRKFRVSS